MVQRHPKVLASFVRNLRRERPEKFAKLAQICPEVVKCIERHRDSSASSLRKSPEEVAMTTVAVARKKTKDENKTKKLKELVGCTRPRCRACKNHAIIVKQIELRERAKSRAGEKAAVGLENKKKRESG